MTHNERRKCDRRREVPGIIREKRVGLADRRRSDRFYGTRADGSAFSRGAACDNRRKVRA